GLSAGVAVAVRQSRAESHAKDVWLTSERLFHIAAPALREARLVGRTSASTDSSGRCHFLWLRQNRRFVRQATLLLSRKEIVILLWAIVVHTKVRATREQAPDVDWKQRGQCVRTGRATQMSQQIENEGRR